MLKSISLGIALSFVISQPLFLPRQVQFSYVAEASEPCKNCKRIGILPLRYSGRKDKIGFYAQGTQDSLIHALSSVHALTLVDRSRTNDVIKEIAFQQSLYVDEKTQIEVGKILGVEYLFTGSIQEMNGTLRIIIEQINVKTNEVYSLAQVTGPVENLFELQDQVAQNILDKLQVHVSTQEKENFTKQLSEPSSLQAYDYFTRGFNAYTHQDYQRAVSDYDQALELNPQYASAYNNRGIVYDDLRDYRKALSDFNQAIEFNPQYADAYYNRGNTYKSLQDAQRAISNYNKALALNPQHAYAYYNRGNTYYDLKDYQRALSDYNQALELNPQDASVYNNRANAYSHLGERLKAIENWKKACNLGFTKACSTLNKQGL